MKYKNIFTLVIITFFSLVIHAQVKYANLQEAVNATATLNGSRGPASVNWINSGKQYSYKSGESIKAFSPETQQDEIIFNAADYTFPGESKKFNYAAFEWSKDSKFILFKTNFRPVWRNSGTSDYYLFSTTSKQLTLLVKDARTAQLSPDGLKIAYEKNGNLFMFNLAVKKEKQLTKDGKGYLYNGRFCWVYEEEFGLVQAWEWSHDSKQIAFWQTDDNNVPVYQYTDYKGVDDDWKKIPYPRVGDPVAPVKIGVVNIATGKNTWMNVKYDSGYIPRIYWTADNNQLAVVHLNRKQNNLNLYFCNILTGKASLIMNEKSATWTEIFNFHTGIMHYFTFPENAKEFYWITDRDNWNHIYRFDYSGKIINQITKGNWEVIQVKNIDLIKKKIYYVSTEVSPTEWQLYEIGLDGNNKKRLTLTPGRHYVNFSPNSEYYIDRYSNISTPTQVELWNTKSNPLGENGLIKKLEENFSAISFKNTHQYYQKELSTFTTSDGQKLDISIIKPANFDPAKRYPLLLSVYGGPNAQSVYNEFAADGWTQFLAQTGYVIVQVNNRGGASYGNAFRSCVYGKLGKWESFDFVETAKFMCKQTYIDTTRLAIYGHSYGGYISAYTVLTYPDIFNVALVTAPVTDYRLYDNIYTERYMGLVTENLQGYIDGSPITFAKNLKCKMLLSHSSSDDNVHVKNTFQLVNAFIDAGKDVDLRIYPPGNHGVAYSPTSRLVLYQSYTDYLNRWLK